MSTAVHTAPRTRFPATAVVAVLCIGSLVGSLMQSLVVPIQAELPTLLGTSASNASWAITATLLASAVTMPVSGRLADMYGKKKVMVVSAALLILGSVIAALADSVLPFLAGRAVQGMAMGYIPVAISMVREVAPPARRASAVAAVSATLGVGGAIGLPLSAWIVQSLDWHWLFWLSTALAAIVLLATVVVVPSVHDAHPGHIDVGGIIGLAVGLVSFLVGISKGSSWGWSSANTIGAIVFGLVVLVAWGAYELRHDDPMVDLRTTARRPVLFTNLAAVLIGFGMMSQIIVVPQLLEMPELTGYGLGQSILAAGLWMAPGGLMMMAFAPVSSALITRAGACVTLAIGAIVIGGGYLFALAMMNAPWQLMVATCVTSAGVGIGYAAMPTLILDNVPLVEAGSSVGVNALMRSVGTTLAGAVMAAVLTSDTVVLKAGTPAIPSSEAFKVCFLLGAGAAIAGALVALLVPRRGGKDAAGVAETATDGEFSGEAVPAAG